jgi:multicomponent K+:H+ antiporter subunit A
MKDGDTLMIIWLMFFPFLISVGLAIFGNRLDRRVKTLLTTGMMASILMALLLNLPNLDADTAQTLPVYDWVPAMGLSVSLYLDGLAVLFGLIVSGIGAVIFIYTHFYFEEDDEHTRFSVWLSAFSGAMLWLVLAGNLLFMFVMWELTSITSFMLIGFYGKTDPNARASATRALVVTGGGGLALLGGILLLGYVNHQVNGVISFDYATLLQLSQLDAHPLYGAILLLIGLGAMTRVRNSPSTFGYPMP